MQIQFTDIIDLTHPIQKDMPHWQGDPLTILSPASNMQRDGYALNSLTIGEHTGTHASSPSHFLPDGKTIDQIAVQNLLLPAVKIDVASKIQADYLLSVQEIQQWEIDHQYIPQGSAVFLQTGWSQKWEQPHAYMNSGMFPGFSEQAAAFLIHERQVVCLGIDSPGIDGFESERFNVNHLLAKSGGFHVENLCNLEKITSCQFYVFIGVLPIAGGHGSPCRILCLHS